MRFSSLLGSAIVGLAMSVSQVSAQVFCTNGVPITTQLGVSVTNSAWTLVQDVFNTAPAPNPTIYMVIGNTYIFNNPTSHPFYIKTAPTTGTSNLYSTGVTNQGNVNGGPSTTFAVPNNINLLGTTLFYQASDSSSLSGQINFLDQNCNAAPTSTPAPTTVTPTTATPTTATPTTPTPTTAAPTTPAPTTVALVNRWVNKPIGCYKDYAAGHILYKQIPVTGAGVNLQTCATAAYNNRFVYFGLANGNQCWAGGEVCTASLLGSASPLTLSNGCLQSLWASVGCTTTYPLTYNSVNQTAYWRNLASVTALVNDMSTNFASTTDANKNQVCYNQATNPKLGACAGLTPATATDACLTSLWNAAGCTQSISFTYNGVNEPAYWRSQPSFAVIQGDMNSWATLNDPAHNNGCYGFSGVFSGTATPAAPTTTAPSFGICTNPAYSCFDGSGSCGDNGYALVYQVLPGPQVLSASSSAGVFTSTVPATAPLYSQAYTLTLTYGSTTPQLPVFAPFTSIGPNAVVSATLFLNCADSTCQSSAQTVYLCIDSTSCGQVNQGDGVNGGYFTIPLDTWNLLSTPTVYNGLQLVGSNGVTSYISFTVVRQPLTLPPTTVTPSTAQPTTPQPTTPTPTASICSQYKTCGTCTASPLCGWCGNPSPTGAGTCYAGNYVTPNDYAGTPLAAVTSCPNSLNWAFVSNSCPVNPTTLPPTTVTPTTAPPTTAAPTTPTPSTLAPCAGANAFTPTCFVYMWAQAGCTTTITVSSTFNGVNEMTYWKSLNDLTLVANDMRSFATLTDSAHATFCASAAQTAPR